MVLGQTIAYSNVLIHVAPCKASLTRNFRAQSPIFEIRFWGEDCRYSIAALRDLQYRSCGGAAAGRRLADFPGRLNAGRL
jgi:hypothetical protein